MMTKHKVSIDGEEMYGSKNVDHLKIIGATAADKQVELNISQIHSIQVDKKVGYLN